MYYQYGFSLYSDRDRYYYSTANVTPTIQFRHRQLTATVIYFHQGRISTKFIFWASLDSAKTLVKTSILTSDQNGQQRVEHHACRIKASCYHTFLLP